MSELVHPANNEPAEADDFADVLSANRAHAETFSPVAAAGVARRELAVVTCMDSRIEPLAMLGLAPGDAKILRNAGARVTDDVLRTLVLGRYLLGIERVMIVAHTNCLMSAPSAAVLRDAVRTAGGPDLADTPIDVAPDQAAQVRADV